MIERPIDPFVLVSWYVSSLHVFHLHLTQLSAGQVGFLRTSQASTSTGYAISTEAFYAGSLPTSSATAFQGAHQGPVDIPGLLPTRYSGQHQQPTCGIAYSLQRCGPRRVLQPRNAVMIVWQKWCIEPWLRVYSLSRAVIGREVCQMLWMRFWAGIFIPVASMSGPASRGNSSFHTSPEARFVGGIKEPARRMGHP